jgi:hypothetical protein
MAAMTYEQMEAELANAMVTSFAAPVVTTKSVPETKSRESLLLKTLSTMTFVIDRLEQQINELQGRIATLEAQPSLKYLGVWKTGTYSAGSFVTDHGAMWHCNVAAASRPGEDGDWTMCAKSGQPVVHPRPDAATAGPRQNGHYARPRS